FHDRRRILRETVGRAGGAPPPRSPLMIETIPDAVKPSPCSILADDADQDPQDVDVVAVDWPHGAVGGLKTDPTALAEDPLEGRLAVVVAHRHDLAVAGLVLLLDDHEVAVGDVLLDHRLARDPQGELAAVVGPVGEGQLL